MIISMANDGDNRRIMENNNAIPGGRGHTDDDGHMVMIVDENDEAYFPGPGGRNTRMTNHMDGAKRLPEAVS